MKPDIKGLEKLAALLKTVKPVQFDMGEWIVEDSCGTRACIMEHTVVAFPNRFAKTNIHTCKSFDHGTAIEYGVKHKASDLHGEYAFAAGFRVSIDEANDIVYGREVSTPKEAAKKIMRLVGRLKEKMVAK